MMFLILLFESKQNRNGHSELVFFLFILIAGHRNSLEKYWWRIFDEGSKSQSRNVEAQLKFLNMEYVMFVLLLKK